MISFLLMVLLLPILLHNDSRSAPSLVAAYVTPTSSQKHLRTLASDTAVRAAAFHQHSHEVADARSDRIDSYNAFRCFWTMHRWALGCLRCRDEPCEDIERKEALCDGLLRFASLQSQSIRKKKDEEGGWWVKRESFFISSFFSSSVSILSVPSEVA